MYSEDIYANCLTKLINQSIKSANMNEFDIKSSNAEALNRGSVPLFEIRLFRIRSEL